MKQKHDYIAVFDSGVGGISVLKHLVQMMPKERYLYFGDSAHAPYGEKAPETVRALTLSNVEKLMTRGVKALVIACNTATALAVDALREQYPDTVIVGIEPAVKQACDAFPGGTVGVMATPVTTDSRKLRDLEARYEKTCRIIPLPTPGLAELVEAGKAVSPESHDLLAPLLAPYAGKLDALVLGCTHYPFAVPVLRQILGDTVTLFDGGEGTARQTRRRLEEAGLLSDGPGEILIENSAEGDGQVRRCRQLLSLTRPLEGGFGASRL